MVAAITAHAGPLQGCDTVPLGCLRYRATATPAFAARWFAEGVTVQTLSRAPGLTFSDKDRLQERWVSLVTGARHPAFPSHRIASSQAFVEACLAGLAWGMNPEVLVAPHLAAGALVELVPGTPLDVALHWQFTRLAAPALRPVTQAIRAAAGESLVQ